MKLKKIKKPKKVKRQSNVNYDTPYQGSIGISKSREAARRMWADNATADEFRLGHVMSQDANGDFIVKTRLSSKAK